MCESDCFSKWKRMIVTEKFDNFLLVTCDESGKTIIFLASKKPTMGLLNMQNRNLAFFVLPWNFRKLIY